MSERLQVITLTVVVPDEITDEVADRLAEALDERGHTIMIEDLSAVLGRVEPEWLHHRIRAEMLRTGADLLVTEPPADGTNDPDQPGRYSELFTSCKHCSRKAAFVSWTAARPDQRHHLCHDHQAGFVIVADARGDKVISEPLP